MGKASKKVKRQVQKKAEEQKIQQCLSKEEELAAAFAAEEYARVLDVLAELIQAKDIKPDLLYKGAYSYFMLGDYERAAQWVNNTLNYDPHNIEARILLARLCFIQERHDDGLAIYEFLVSNYAQNISPEHKEQILDSSEYYARRDGEKLRQNYPHLSTWLQTREEMTASVPQAAVKESGQTGSALSALQRLKAKLQAVEARQEKADGETVEKEGSAPEVSVAEQKIAEIKSKNCSYREKIKLCNNFAAAEYMTGNYRQAEVYLHAALEMDDGDSQTIRNMAMVQAALGEKDKAQALVARLPEVDFLLLYMLKEQG